MTKLFVPYHGDRPASIWIKGHKLMILSNDQEALGGSLGLFGADKLKTLNAGDSRAEQERVIDELARKEKAGVVLASGDVSLPDLLRSLESELMWIQ